MLSGAVGIALVLRGSLFLANAALKAELESTLLFDQLIANASKLSPPWLHASFVLLFIGYGSKMARAPMHTWKPDPHSEAPGSVGTLPAGRGTGCAFRSCPAVHQIGRPGT